MTGGRWKVIRIAVILAGIVAYLCLLYLAGVSARVSDAPLWVAIAVGGLPLLWELLRKLLRREFGADFLAALSIVTAVAMGQLLVAAIIVLMLAGGQTLEEYATRRASSVLSALAKRTPSIAHRVEQGRTVDLAVAEVQVGDRLVVFPHEICPVDGTVLEGSGTMDESFLTGEPFRIRKVRGSQVISGALNEQSAMTIVAEKEAVDSRYARIMQVVEEAERNPPAIRRLGDRLGAIYTPVAVGVALVGWLASGDPQRFLAVLVIATPCPLLLAIPTAIMGAISLAAKRGIIIKKPAVLEQVSGVRTMLFDKTGTLTHAEPVLSEVVPLGTYSADEVLRLAASLEQYSKHPLAAAILRGAAERRIALGGAKEMSERPGEGLRGEVDELAVLITGRGKLAAELAKELPATQAGMECVVLLDGVPAALMRFHDRPRSEGRPFVSHLGPKHRVKRLMILSGDRDAEVQHLAQIVGITDVRAGLAPEQKLEIVQEETRRAATLFLGDGINDAPAMMAATVGVAFGQNSDITAQAAGAVILDATLERVDEFLHIGARMKRIALQSAVGGMIVSTLGMALAAFGLLPPLAGAVSQEVIDLLAVLNALRASLPSRELQDFQ